MDQIDIEIQELLDKLHSSHHKQRQVEMQMESEFAKLEEIFDINVRILQTNLIINKAVSLDS